jgi:hypothetical protein
MKLPERCARRTLTSLITILAVAAGLVLMTLAQYFSASLQAEQPDLSACDNLLPTLYFQGSLNYSFAKAFNAKPGTVAQTVSAYDGPGILNQARAPSEMPIAGGPRALLRGPRPARAANPFAPAAAAHADAAVAATAAANAPPFPASPRLPMQRGRALANSLTPTPSVSPTVSATSASLSAAVNAALQEQQLVALKFQAEHLALVLRLVAVQQLR